MTGIYAEKTVLNGRSMWAVKDIETQRIVSFGTTVSDAVQNYEIIVANKEMEKSLGMNPDDFI